MFMIDLISSNKSVCCLFRGPSASPCAEWFVAQPLILACSHFPPTLYLRATGGIFNYIEILQNKSLSVVRSMVPYQCLAGIVCVTLCLWQVWKYTDMIVCSHIISPWRAPLLRCYALWPSSGFTFDVNAIRGACLQDARFLLSVLHPHRISLRLSCTLFYMGQKLTLHL